MTSIRKMTRYEKFMFDHVGPWFDYLYAHMDRSSSVEEVFKFYKAIIWC